MTTTMEDCDNENKEEEDAVTPCHRPIPTMVWMEIPASFTPLPRSRQTQTNIILFIRSIFFFLVFSKKEISKIHGFLGISFFFIKY